MEDNFTPQPGDTSISIPVTFDYRGGRGANIKHKITAVIVFLVIAIVGSIFFWKSDNFFLWQKFIYDLISSNPDKESFDIAFYSYKKMMKMAGLDLEEILPYLEIISRG